MGRPGRPGQHLPEDEHVAVRHERVPDNGDEKPRRDCVSDLIRCRKHRDSAKLDGGEEIKLK
jgi:hypothetical protein